MENIIIKGVNMKKILIYNFNKIRLVISLLLIFLFCISLIKKDFKYLDTMFFTMLGLIFIIHIYIRKEILVMLITKENKNLKEEELMKCEYIFLEKILYITRERKKEIKKNIEIEEKILNKLFEE